MAVDDATKSEDELEQTEEELIAEAESAASKKTPVKEEKADNPEEKQTDEAKKEEAGEDDVLDILQKDFGWKPKTDNGYEELKGLVAAARKIGERDEDAIFAKQMRQALDGREEEFEEFLTGKKTEQKKTEPEEKLPSIDEYKLLQLQASAENAPKSIKERFARVQEAILENALNPAKSVKSEIEQLRDEIKSLKQTSTQTQAQTELRNEVESHVELLHVDGDVTKPLLPFGEKVFAEYQELLDDGVPAVKAFKRAVRYATAASPIATPPRKIVGARRAPAVAAPPVAAAEDQVSEKRKDGSLKTPDELANDLLEDLIKHRTSK